MKKYVTCYARGQDGHWEAICVDFDIMVEGNSFEHVKESLSHAVKTYVEDALAEDEAVATELLSRAAPAHVRLYWAWSFFVTSLLGRRHDGDNSTLGFSAACPA